MTAILVLLVALCAFAALCTALVTVIPHAIHLNRIKETVFSMTRDEMCSYLGTLVETGVLCPSEGTKIISAYYNHRRKTMNNMLRNVAKLFIMLLCINCTACSDVDTGTYMGMALLAITLLPALLWAFYCDSKWATATTLPCGDNSCKYDEPPPHMGYCTSCPYHVGAMRCGMCGSHYVPGNEDKGFCSDYCMEEAAVVDGMYGVPSASADLVRITGHSAWVLWLIGYYTYYKEKIMKSVNWGLLLVVVAFMATVLFFAPCKAATDGANSAIGFVHPEAGECAGFIGGMLLVPAGRKRRRKKKYSAADIPERHMRNIRYWTKPENGPVEFVWDDTMDCLYRSPAEGTNIFHVNLPACIEDDRTFTLVEKLARDNGQRCFKVGQIELLRTDNGVYMQYPSGHSYGRSDFHMACSTYSCGTCSGWCDGPEDCKPTVSFFRNEDSQNY